MTEFRDYNLIELVEEVQNQMGTGTASEYLEWFSPEIRYEIIINFNAISDAQKCSQEIPNFFKHSLLD